MPYPLLSASTTYNTPGVSTPDLQGQILHLTYTRETWRSAIPAVTRTTPGVGMGPSLAPVAATSAPPVPTTGQLWPRGT